MMTTSPIIETLEVSKIYGMSDIQVFALDSVSITINAGEFVAVMGPSGSGKSTLMNILGCLDRPSKGSYILDGVDVSEMDRAQLAGIRNTRIGFIFQSYNLLARTSALKNVMAPLIYKREDKLSVEEQVQRSEQALERVGLADRLHHLPQELSGGQSQRVAIARALVNDPVLVLADEPTGNLDSKSGREIMDLLHDLHRQGRTIVMVTHDPEIAAHTERTIHLRDGHIDQVIRNGEKPQAAMAEGVEHEPV